MNGKVVKTIYNSKEWVGHYFQIRLPSSTSQANPADLILLVENMGRVNYEMAPHTLEGETKGLKGEVAFNGKSIQSWKIYNMEMDSNFISQLSQSQEWKNAQNYVQTHPSFYRTLFNSDGSKDYYLNTKLWSKGVAFVNNFNLGRYWSVGPQQTLYLPAAVMNSGQNKLIMLELEKAGNSLSLDDYPIYGPPCEMPCYPWGDEIF